MCLHRRGQWLMNVGAYALVNTPVFMARAVIEDYSSSQLRDHRGYARDCVSNSDAIVSW